MRVQYTFLLSSFAWLKPFHWPIQCHCFEISGLVGSMWNFCHSEAICQSLFLPTISPEEKLEKKNWKTRLFLLKATSFFFFLLPEMLNTLVRKHTFSFSSSISYMKNLCSRNYNCNNWCVNVKLYMQCICKDGRGHSESGEETIYTHRNYPFLEVLNFRKQHFTLHIAIWQQEKKTEDIILKKSER